MLCFAFSKRQFHIIFSGFSSFSFLSTYILKSKHFLKSQYKPLVIYICSSIGGGGGKQKNYLKEECTPSIHTNLKTNRKKEKEKRKTIHIKGAGKLNFTTTQMLALMKYRITAIRSILASISINPAEHFNRIRFFSALKKVYLFTKEIVLNWLVDFLHSFYFLLGFIYTTHTIM